MIRKCLFFWIGIISVAIADYPDKTVHIYLPFPIGGPTYELVETIFENNFVKKKYPFKIHPNTLGIKSSAYVKLKKNLPNDGYHFIVGNLGTHASATIFQGLKLGYDPLSDFIPVTMLGRVPLYILVRKNLCLQYAKDQCTRKIKNFKELIAYMRYYKKRVSIAHYGKSSTAYLAAIQFTTLSKTTPTLLTYSGATQALRDLTDGKLDVLIDQSTSSLPYIRTGAVKALAHTWDDRTRRSMTEEVPKFIDITGWQEFDITGWNILYAPQGTPVKYVKRMNAIMNTILKDAYVAGNILMKNTLLYDDIKNTSRKLYDFNRSQIQYWKEIINSNKF